MRIGIFGSGAIGQSIASEIYKYNKEIIYLAALGKYYDRVKDGIYVNDIKYNLKVTDNLKMDYLFICVKNYSLESSFDDIKTFVDKNTIIIPLLNGVSAHDRLHKEFLVNRVLYGMIKIEANQKDYTHTYTGGIKILTFGERFNPSISAYLLPLCDVLNNSKINYKVMPDMEACVWKKWMLNIGINQVSSLTNSTYDDMRHPYLKELLYELYKEIASLAMVVGVNLHQADADDLYREIDTYTSNRYTSMAQDFMNERRNELEYFSGYALELAKKYKVGLPYNEMIYKLLKAKSDNYMKKVKK